MHAILINNDNMEKINESSEFSGHERTALALFNMASADFYFIEDYVDWQGRRHSHTILPGYLLADIFDVHLDDAKSDWLRLTRKFRNPVSRKE